MSDTETGIIMEALLELRSRYSGRYVGERKARYISRADANLTHATDAYANVLRDASVECRKRAFATLRGAFCMHCGEDYTEIWRICHCQSDE